jgi:tetratricopeptide (TPR) repeat protein
MMPLHSSFCKPLVLVFCWGGFLLSGCALDSGMVDPYEARAKREAAVRQEKPEQPATEIVRRDVLMPVKSSINNRIRAYEQKIEEWREVERKTATMNLPQEKLNRIDECRSHLQHILIEYNALQKQLQQETRIEAAQLLAGNSLLQLNQQDIDYLESGCGKFLAELKTVSQPIAAVPPDPQIKAAYDSGDYGQVVNLYVQGGTVPGQVFAGETTFQYGQALLKNHQEAEAQKVLGELLGRVRQQKGQDELLLRLLQSVADLNFGLETYEEARKHYEELIRVSIDKGAQQDEWAGLQLAALQTGGAVPAEMKEYSILLRNYLAYVPKRDGYNVAERADKFLLAYPASRLVANVNAIKKTTREQADAWLSQGIKRIETQAGERRAQEPPAVDGQVPGGGPQPGNAMTPGTSLAGGVLPTTAAGNEKALQEDYDKGVAHLQAKEYDKAIERFNRLQRTPYEGKARPQMEEAAKLAAQDLRQKAAELFVRATNSRDTEEKRKLLLSSRDLLQSILVKYPQSGLTDKVQKNLARIEAELRAVDAGGAQRPPASGGAYVPSNAGAGVPVTSAPVR